MANFGFIIDNRKCIGCHACTVACKSEHQVPIGVNRTWVKYIEKGQFPNSQRLFSVMRCNHCDDAPCVEICPVTALFRRDDGIVDFDNRRCIGCKACMQACPYDALYINPETRTAAKCNYCAHRIDRGLEPACVNVCPTEAIISGDLDDPTSKISQIKSRNQVSARKTEKGTKPALFYINGDTDSLDPLATNQNDESMWGKQVAGVGHWAEDHQPHALDRLGSLLNLGDSTALVESNDTPKPDPQRAENLLQSVAPKPRRAYDAPQKGVLWGWQVSGYLWTKSISAGICMLLMLFHFLGGGSFLTVEIWGSGIALVFLGLTGILLMWDLDQPKRFLYVLLRPQWRSWLVKGAYIITGFGLFLTIFLAQRLAILANTENLFFANNQIPDLFSVVVGVPLLVLAFLSAIYTAFLFAQAKGRDFWQSPALPIQMLLHSILAGAACLVILYEMQGGYPLGDRRTVYMTILVVGILLHLGLTAFELGTTHPTAASKRTAWEITQGRYKSLFWIGAIVIGNVIPMLMFADHWINWIPEPFYLVNNVVASLLVLIGVFIAQHIWVRAPQQIPLS